MPQNNNSLAQLAGTLFQLVVRGPLEEITDPKLVAKMRKKMVYILQHFFFNFNNKISKNLVKIIKNKQKI
jgi:hypothetical protein